MIISGNKGFCTFVNCVCACVCLCIDCLAMSKRSLIMCIDCLAI